MKLRQTVGRIIPEFAWIPLIAEFSLNMLVYSGCKVIAGSWYHYNIETKYDMMIPFVPWTVVIYLGCYLFWCANYILSVRQGEEQAYRFLSADFLAKCICCVFFLLIPTTNTRPVLEDTGIWNWIMGLVYQIDSPDNLFPSIHCLTSWMCYIGVRGQKNVPKWYQIFSCLMAVAVFISTLTTKQHVLADVAGGFLLAELSYWIAGHTSLAQGYRNVFQRITGKIFG